MYVFNLTACDIWGKKNRDCDFFVLFFIIFTERPVGISTKRAWWIWFSYVAHMRRERMVTKICFWDFSLEFTGSAFDSADISLVASGYTSWSYAMILSIKQIKGKSFKEKENPSCCLNLLEPNGEVQEVRKYEFN